MMLQKNLYSLCDIIAFNHIEKITDKYEIYGNSNLTQKEFNQKVENGYDSYKNSNDLYNFFSCNLSYFTSLHKIRGLQ